MLYLLTRQSSRSVAGSGSFYSCHVGNASAMSDLRRHSDLCGTIQTHGHKSHLRFVASARLVSKHPGKRRMSGDMAARVSRTTTAVVLDHRLPDSVCEHLVTSAWASGGQVASI